MKIEEIRKELNYAYAHQSLTVSRFKQLLKKYTQAVHFSGSSQLRIDFNNLKTKMKKDAKGNKKSK